MQVHYYCQLAKSFEIGVNSPSNACNYNVFVAKCFFPLINLDRLATDRTLFNS